jgi:prolyl 4-hydroxylase
MSQQEFTTSTQHSTNIGWNTESPCSPLFPFPQIALTVQDRPWIPPVYNGVNPHYPGLQMIHSNPPIFLVEQFLSPYECQFLVHAASDSFGPAPVVGPGSGEISPSRTSSTCYLAREDLPDYLRKVSILTGKPIEHCELPQVGRYLPSQQYLQHLDAFDLSQEDGRRFAANGGQRTVTVLVYLNDVSRGGATHFPTLNLTIQPKQGMAVVFFPATIDGYMDTMVLHAALPAIDTKYVSQVWIRQGPYIGQASKRLQHILGTPFVPP